MTFAQCVEIWQGFVGNQTPDEFMEISRSRGYNTAEEAAYAYVINIPEMFADGDQYTSDDLRTIADGITAYLRWHGYN